MICTLPLTDADGNQALESLEDILAQCTDILGEIESIVAHHRNTKDRDGKDAEQNGRIKPNSAVVARLNYLVAHLDALRLTTSVMLQTLYTSQSIIWAKSVKIQHLRIG